MNDSLFTSSQIAKIRLIVDSHDVFSLLHHIALETGPNLQFIDNQLNVPIVQRKYSLEVFKCEALLKKLATFESILTQSSVPILDLKSNYTTEPFDQKGLEEFQKHIDERLQILQRIKAGNDSSMEKVIQKEEHYHLFANLQRFYGSYFFQVGKKKTKSEDDPFIDKYADNLKMLSLLVSVDNEYLYPLNKMILKLTHGNIVWREAQINFEQEKKVKKSGFIVFVQGAAIRDKIRDICLSFKASVFEVDHEKSELQDQFMIVYSELLELKRLIQQSEIVLRDEMNSLAAELAEWKSRVSATLLLFTNLNKMTIEQQTCRVFCWCLKSEIPQILSFIQNKSSSPLTNLQEVPYQKSTAPTHYPLNVFFDGFQTLVNTYGIPTRSETNPMIFNLITFPFFFGLMFPDVGHGLILLVFVIAMFYGEITKPNPSKNKISFAYVLLLASLAAIFAGVLFDEIFSKPFLAFFSSYKIYDTEKNYWSGFGLSPKWSIADNKMSFTNSLKMKFSIIIAYFHQLFGMCLSVLNDTRMGKYENLFLQAIPKITFFSLLIGYMVFWIFYKWIFFSATTSEQPPILQLFLDYVMRNKERKSFFFGQYALETVMWYLMIASLQIIIFAKPAYTFWKRRQPKLNSTNVEETHSAIVNAYGADEIKKEPKDGSEDTFFNDLIMHFIDSFEFTLETISNTASYLRLWAISLAHSVISDIVWDMVLTLGFQTGRDLFLINEVFLVLITIVWVFLQIGFLVCIEGLSSILHAVRLHWVEFQNKFFKGAGHKFLPIKYQN